MSDPMFADASELFEMLERQQQTILLMAQVLAALGFDLADFSPASFVDA